MTVLADQSVFEITEREHSKAGKGRRPLDEAWWQVSSVPLRQVEDIFSGYNQSFALVQKTGEFKTGSSSFPEVFAWGDNHFGQLGVANSEERVLKKPQPVLNLPAERIFEVTVGKDHTLFLTQGGTLYGCGSNLEGRMGSQNGSLANNTNIPQPIKILFQDKIDWVVASDLFTIAGTQNKKIYSWGHGCSFVLGNTKESIEASPTEIPSQFLLNNEGAIAVGSSHVIFAQGLERASQTVLSLEKSGSGFKKQLNQGGKHFPTILEKNTPQKQKTMLDERAEAQASHGNTLNRDDAERPELKLKALFEGSNLSLAQRIGQKHLDLKRTAPGSLSDLSKSEPFDVSLKKPILRVKRIA